jgi:hypothetical protein
MTPKEKAINLVDNYRIILMNKDTECGEEILCTVIAKQCALIAVDEVMCEVTDDDDISWWNKVKQEIQLL